MLPSLIPQTITLKDLLNEGDILRAEGRIVSDHRKMPAAEVIVTNQEGVHIATFTGQAYVGRTGNTFSALE